MQNIVVDMCEKFHNDRLRNDRALVVWKSDNNNRKKKHNNNKNVGSALWPVSVSKNCVNISIRVCSIKWILQLRFDFDSTTTNIIHFFDASKGVVANKKAVAGAYNDVIVYVTLIRMAFTLTDQHRVASFDCRRWYNAFTYFRSKMPSGMNSCVH